MNLNDQQRDIVKMSKGFSTVMAGAGAGKSTTNIELITKLHLEDGIPLDRMFISTFTNKAGRDLKLKLSKRLGLDSSVLKKLWVGTFHSLGFRYLTQIRKRKITIILPVEASNFVKNITKETLKENKIDSSELSLSDILDVIGKHRNSGVPFQELSSEYGDVISEIFKTYQEEKTRMGLVDYDDILDIFESELKDDALFRNKFDWVFVDECQDNSPAQVRLADLLTCKNQILIGDLKQSIYGFRGAAPELFKHKIDKADNVFYLSYNYRSSKEIINFANAMLEDYGGFKNQTLIPTKKSSSKPTLVICDKQAEHIVNSIRKQISMGVPVEEIAILGRSVKSPVFANIQTLLRYYNIPYSVRGGVDRLNSNYLQNFLSLLRSLVSPTQVSLTNTLCLLPSIGMKTALKLSKGVSDAGGDLEVLRSVSTAFAKKPAYHEFLDLEQYHYDSKELFKRSLDFFYKHHLVPVYGKKDIQLAKDKKTIIFESLYKILIESPSLLEGIDSLYINEEDDELLEGKLVISTVHQAKGLEWDCVHIANFYQGSMPQVSSKSTEEDIEEEFCVAYVAVTRARKSLLMYMPFQKDSFNSKGDPNSTTKLSQFIDKVIYKTKDEFLNVRFLDVISESKSKDNLYNKLKAKYEKNSKN